MSVLRYLEEFPKPSINVSYDYLSCTNDSPNSMEPWISQLAWPFTLSKNLEYI